MRVWKILAEQRQANAVDVKFGLVKRHIVCMAVRDKKIGAYNAHVKYKIKTLFYILKKHAPYGNKLNRIESMEFYLIHMKKFIISITHVLSYLEMPFQSMIDINFTVLIIQLLNQK